MAQDSVGAGAVYVGNLRSRDISGKEIVEESESESEVESDEESSAYEEEDETDNMIEKILGIPWNEINVGIIYSRCT